MNLPSPCEEVVRAQAIDTFRALLPILAPNIAGYEMRALPELVIEGAKRTAENRDHYKRLFDQRGKDAADAEEQVTSMRSALEMLHDELVNFAHYSRGVAAECVGERRDMWQERAAWSDKLARAAGSASRA